MTAAAAPGTRTADLLHRVAQVEQAVARGGRAVPADTAAAVLAALEEIKGRLALGVDHTVVALVGGTGSGKSSLFNALTGLDFADVGVRRPTTSQVTACVWSREATALLDWLGVSADRRIERESELDGDSQADLRGLVLLDLPDHDSVEPEHRAVVDRLLPQVDLIAWVVDPQKYADDALHTGYLSNLAGHEASMLVVLNQIDTVPTGAQGTLMRDVDRLLREDGLTGVGVHGVSARTGAGLPVLRGVLAQAVEHRGVAEVRVRAELDDAARQLAATVADRELDETTVPRQQAVQGLARAVGLPGTVETVRKAVGGGGRIVPGAAQGDSVELVRQAWLEEVRSGLPAPWQVRVEESAGGATALTSAVDAELGEVAAPAPTSRAATAWRVLAGMAALAALVLGGLAGGVLLGVGGWTDGAALAGAGAGAALLTAWALRWLGRRSARSAARRRAATFEAAVLAALGRVVDDHLGTPALAVLADHRAVRETTGAVREVTGAVREVSDGAPRETGDPVGEVSDPAAPAP